METGLDLVLVLVALTNLRLLASSRLGACIRVTAMQGVLLGLMPILSHAEAAPLRLGGLAIGSVILKGVVFPRLLFRALREADISREVEPLVGYIPSLLFGVGGLGISIWLGGRLPLPGPLKSELLVPVAFFSVMAGFFLIVGRRGAVHQVLGFLVMENGIYTFGIGAMETASLLVELGVLLDVFVAVFVMGITIFHISREFAHIETDRLSSLRD
jgi:hydrogenase-4 component E